MQENLATLRRRGVHVRRSRGRAARRRRRRRGSPRRARRASSPPRPTRARRRRPRPRRACGSLVTAGGTREPIDPVRFIGNRSSGKMGYAVAEVAAAPRAPPSPSSPPSAGRRRRRRGRARCETAAEMQDAVLAPGRRRRRRRDGRRGRRLPAQGAAGPEAQEGTTGSPRSCSSPRHDFLVDLGRGQARRARCSSGSRPRPTTCVEQRGRRSSRRKRLDLIVANDVAAARRRASRSTPTGRSSSTPPAASRTLPLLDQDRRSPGVILDRVARACSSAERRHREGA